MTTTVQSEQRNINESAKPVDMTRSEKGKAGSEQSGLLQTVCFRLGNEDFGINIHQVQEIIRMVKVTKIPQSASFVEGVINLRGKIVPVIDLRQRFGFPPTTEQTKESRVIVIETLEITVGMIVDEVTEVFRLPMDSIKPTPEIARSEVAEQYIQGVTNFPVRKDDPSGRQDRLLIVLDTTRIFSSEESRVLHQMAEETEK